MAAQMAAKKKDEVEFSDKLSLADNYKTTYGVKFAYEGKTYEEKKRIVTTKDLKKTLSQRKLSIEQFKLLKNQNGNNREEFEHNLKKQTVINEQRPPRSRSQARFSS